MLFFFFSNGMVNLELVTKIHLEVTLSHNMYPLSGRGHFLFLSAIPACPSCRSQAWQQLCQTLSDDRAFGDLHAQGRQGHLDQLQVWRRWFLKELDLSGRTMTSFGWENQKIYSPQHRQENRDLWEQRAETRMQLAPAGAHPAISPPVVLASAARVSQGVGVCKSHRSSEWGSHHQQSVTWGAVLLPKEVFHLVQQDMRR